MSDDTRHLPAALRPEAVVVRLAAAMAQSGRTFDPVEQAFAEEFARIYCEAMRPGDDGAPAAAAPSLRVAMEAMRELRAMTKPPAIEDTITRGDRARQADVVVDQTPDPALEHKMRLLRPGADAIRGG